MIFLWLLLIWVASAILSLACWAPYVLLWTWLHWRTAPLAQCKAAFERDRLNRALLKWVSIELFPVRVARAWWGWYVAHLRVWEQAQDALLKEES